MLRTRLRSYLKATTIVDILPLRSIQPSRYPLREDIGNLTELVLSIKKRGLLEPIIVRPTKTRFEIVAGHRRFTACKIIGLSEVPAIIVDVSEREAFEISLEENLHRKTLGPIEEAKAFRFYVDKYGYGSVTQLAVNIGKSQEYVSQRLALLSLPNAVQTLVMRRLISSSDGWEISRVKDPVTQKRLAEAVADEKLTVKEIRQLANLVKDQALPLGDIDQDHLSSRVLPENLWDRLEKNKLRESKIRRNAALLLRATLIKLDDVIDQIDCRSPLRNDLMKLRLSTHELIDDFMNPARKSDNATAEITDLIEKYLRIMNQRDLSLFDNIRHEKFSLYDDLPPLRLMNLKEGKEHISRIIRAIDESNCRIADLDIKIFGKMALATFVFIYDIVIRGFQFISRSRASLIFVLSDLGWKIFHEHWSLCDYETSLVDKLWKVQKSYGMGETDTEIQVMKS